MTSIFGTFRRCRLSQFGGRTKKYALSNMSQSAATELYPNLKVISTLKA